MSRESERRADHDEPARAASSVAPGKRARTDNVNVQRKAPSAGGGLPFMDVMLKANQVQETAAAGVASASGALPHVDRIQASFGAEHDLSSVRAGIGGTAGDAASTIGAQAYATSDRVAFQSTPDLHTAAHEAAHIVQQREGVQLDGGVGRNGDAYERQADAIADRVVAGQSSADLLGGAARGTSTAVQMRRVLDNADALLFDPNDATKEGANARAHQDGLNTLIARARAELTSDELDAYAAEALAGMSVGDFFALPRHEILARMTKALAKGSPRSRVRRSEAHQLGCARRDGRPGQHRQARRQREEDSRPDHRRHLRLRPEAGLRPPQDR